MSKKVDVIKIKQDRGQIMINLDLFYPKKVMLKTLYRTVCGDPTYDKSKFERDITLLGQRGYLALSRNMLDDSDCWESQMCILTDKGKLIAEGTQTDDCLEL